MKLAKYTIATLAKLNFKQPAQPEVRTNPYTKRSHTLEPEAVQLYDFITTRTHVCGQDFNRRDWDNARYYFQSRWPEQYMDLLD